MAVRTIDHFYRTYEEAVQVVADLAAHGVPASDINLIESESDARLPAEVSQDAAQAPAGTGATLGAVIGGGIGALAGVGAITLPYIDPLLQTGWVLPTVTFAGIGALLGALFGAVTKVGVTNRKAHVIAEGLTRGEHLVVVRVDEQIAAQIEAVMDRPRATGPLPEPAFDLRYAPDTRSIGEQTAELRQAERTIQYKSE